MTTENTSTTESSSTTTTPPQDDGWQIWCRRGKSETGGHIGKYAIRNYNGKLNYATDAEDDQGRISTRFTTPHTQCYTCARPLRDEGFQSYTMVRHFLLEYNNQNNYLDIQGTTNDIGWTRAI